MRNEYDFSTAVKNPYIDIENDIATLDDLANHEAAMQEYLLGETIDHTEIDWS